MKNLPVKFGVLGCGHIGKRHAAMITRNPNTILLGMADIRPADQLHLEDYNDVPVFSNIEELLSAVPDIDIVSIATPNGLHAQHAIKCLEAGKHIVVEKPLALTKYDAEKVIHKAFDTNRHVFSVMQNRYSPPSRWLKDIVSSGVLGSVYMVQLNCYWNRDERYYKPGGWHGTIELDGGTLFTQFSHFIDILYWLFGDIHKIHSRFASFNHEDLTDFEDSGFVSFELNDGGLGCINFSTSVWNKNLESSITILAENGSIKVGGQYMNEVEYCHIKNYQMPVLPPTNPANDYNGYKGSAANHHYIIDNVVDVLTGKAVITTNAMEGLKVVEIIERMYKSGQLPTVWAEEWRSGSQHTTYMNELKEPSVALRRNMLL